MMFRRLRFRRALKNLRLRPEERLDAKNVVLRSVRTGGAGRQSEHMNEQEFLEAAARITLDAHEKVRHREGLLRSISHGNSHRWFPSLKRMTSVVASVLIVSIAGVGVSVAAENAMPGDMLYPIKIMVNEEIPMRLARSTERQAAVALWQTERRVEEARTMAAHDMNEPERLQELSTHFEKNMTVVNEKISTLTRGEDAARIHATGMREEAVLAAPARAMLQKASPHDVLDMAEDMTAQIDDAKDLLKNRLQPTLLRSGRGIK